VRTSIFVKEYSPASDKYGILLSQYVLWHEGPLLGNDSEISLYTTAVSMLRLHNRHERNNSTEKIVLQQSSGIFYLDRAERL
jgi:hypothetical protein